MLLITAKKEPSVAGQLKEEPSVAKESQENQQSVIKDNQPSSDAENIQTSSESKAIHSSNTEALQNEALQEKQSPQTSEERTASTKSSENEETPLNPRVVSVGQNEVFCAATGRPCASPSTEHAHEQYADSASQAETLNSENVDSETRTSPEDSAFDSGSETSTEASQSSQITNDCSSINDEHNTQCSEHETDEKTQDQHAENVDPTVRT